MKKHEELTSQQKFLIKNKKMQHPEFWKFPMGINEGENYGRYEYKYPLSIKELIEIAEKFDGVSRFFGMWGFEDLYGIRGKSGNMEWWFTVSRNRPYEKINWLSKEKVQVFISHSVLDQIIKEED
jgi:hypothetical protein